MKRIAPTRPRTPAQEADDLQRLSRLLPLWPHEIADRTVAGRQRLIATIRNALRRERRRGLNRDWTYDLARHAALMAAYRRELTGLRDAKRPRNLAQSGHGRQTLDGGGQS